MGRAKLFPPAVIRVVRLAGRWHRSQSRSKMRAAGSFGTIRCIRAVSKPAHVHIMSTASS
eukprot:8208188-Heterocapsa_arctica.AAC.1